MSKYAGSIDIYDDEGTSVFSRELIQDEIIECLLEDRKVEQMGGAGAVIVPVDAVVSDDEKRVVHECCGSTGSRHFKSCKSNREERIVSRGKFSEKTWHTIKDLFGAGLSSDAIAAEKGFDPEEVRKIRLTQSYDQYFRGV